MTISSFLAWWNLLFLWNAETERFCDAELISRLRVCPLFLHDLQTRFLPVYKERNKMKDITDTVNDVCMVRQCNVLHNATKIKYYIKPVTDDHGWNDALQMWQLNFAEFKFS